MAKKCFLCDWDDFLIDFNDETFQNCSLKLAFRKKMNFKYNEVELTKASPNFVGYHTTCYKTVTALGNKYNEEFRIFSMENTNFCCSVADKGPKCLNSSVHSRTTVTEGEGNNVDDISHISADLDEFFCKTQLSGSTTKKQHNQHLDCINYMDLSLKLGSKVCQSLPAFHTYTGCDYTAAFYNKGKIRPFKIFSKNEKYQTIFASLTDEADIFIDEKMNAVQEFTAKMYCVNDCTRVNDARNRIFMKNYVAKKDSEQFLRKIKSFDSNTIPPCWISLQQKILRTIFVNSMWLNATDFKCIKLRHEKCGLHLDNYLNPTGFIGDQTHLKIQDIVEMTENNDESTEFEAHSFTSDELETK